ncbi:cytochrome P450 [Streptomyces sp. NBC_00258]|uniref:cytochrome P450 n=1 Tax=Streptomyces sp. NBC_00258 TaxID=2903642 RepID=UPI002E2900A7|nr:cytochrome P450 [Streptomyces sp. NBC_00258]
MSTGTAPFTFDPFVYEDFQTDPGTWEIYTELRESHPVYYNADLGFWALSRFDDVKKAARDWKTFSSADGVTIDDIAGIVGPGNFIDMDPPRHDVYRDLVKDWFSVNAVNTLQQVIAEEAEARVKQIVARGGGDLAQELSFPLPVSTIAHVLGLPSSDVPMLAEWVQLMASRDSGSLSVPEAARSTGDKIHHYFEEFLAERRRNPGSDVVGGLAHAEAEGAPIGDGALGMLTLLLEAGSETTAALISNAVILFARHPDQRALLLENPQLLDAAVEEVLRVEPSLPYTVRTTRTSVELHGQTIPEGAKVALVFAAANRDPRRWEEPDRFNIARQRKRHIAFNEGVHSCLGSVLAKMETRTVLSAILKHMPDYVLNGEIVRTPTYTITRGVSHLPVGVAPSS